MLKEEKKYYSLFQISSNKLSSEINILEQNSPENLPDLTQFSWFSFTVLVFLDFFEKAKSSNSLPHSVQKTPLFLGVTFFFADFVTFFFIKLEYYKMIILFLIQ